MLGQSISFYIKLAVAIILLSAIGGYAFYLSTDLRNGPEVTITNPENGSTIHQSPIQITGVAKNISAISLNDLPIFVDESGNWQEERLLAPGYNLLTIKAKDRFNREVIKTLELVFDPKSTTTTP